MVYVSLSDVSAWAIFFTLLLVLSLVVLSPRTLLNSPFRALDMVSVPTTFTSPLSVMINFFDI